MWMRTQSKQMLLNSDNITSIFIGKTGTKIFANVSNQNMTESAILLGEYKDRDTCLDILEVILIVGAHDKVKWIQLPLGGDVEKWLEDSIHMAEKLYN